MSLSPMMQQYLKIKEQNKENIVFFRLGDFYEMFFDDAILVSKELELTLTGRDCGLEQRAPMCGVPFHSCEGYIKKLVDKGYKVAICEQTQNVNEAKGIVRREIVRIITPGTLIENQFLDESKNNFIASIYTEENQFSVSFGDISTGDVYVCQMQTDKDGEQITNELVKFLPSEILFNDKFVDMKHTTSFMKDKLKCVAELIEDKAYTDKLCASSILNLFRKTNLSELNIESMPLAIKSLGALIQYLNYTQEQGAKRLVNLHIYDNNDYMSLDIDARRNLELTQTMKNGDKKATLLWVLDKTKTSMGKRLIRKFIEQPLLNLSQITKRHSAVNELLSDIIQRDSLTEALSGIYDIERLTTKLVYNKSNPRDVNALGQTCSKLPEIKKLMNFYSSPLLTHLCKNIDTLDEISQMISETINDNPPIAIKDGGVIKKGVNDLLDEFREISSNAKSFITKIEIEEKEKTGIKTLKVGYNRVFGYYIEVTKLNSELVPENYIRKQTLANCERYITQELKELEQKVLSADDKIFALESQIFEQLCKNIATKLNAIQKTSGALAEIDVLLSFANVSAQNNYVCPQMSVNGEITIKDGRHPVVELLCNDLFVPNDANLNNSDDRVMIITGPNMAGKSTYMRQTALIILMAQVGCFVPAKHAKLTIVDKIFTRVGASDDVSSGQSTFMVEMKEVANILKYATPKSFVILDEIGRGTSTFDGMSIARAVVEHITTNKDLKCKTMFATHYHELTDLEQQFEGIKNYNIVAKKNKDTIIFLRKIVRGGADDSYGIDVAKLAGVPQKVINRANEILLQLENGQAVETNRKPVIENENIQISIEQQNISIIEQRIKNIDINTLTPIEALNLLGELKKSI